MKGDYSNYKTRSYKNAWDKLKIEHPIIASKIGYWNYRKMLSDMSDQLIESVLTDSDGFELPFSLGTLRMIGIRIASRPKSMKFSKLSLSRTENVIYNLAWLRTQKHSKVPNFYFYAFKTSILVRKIITQYIRTDKFFKWLILDSFDQVKHLKKFNDVEDTVNRAAQRYKL